MVLKQFLKCRNLNEPYKGESREGENGWGMFRCTFFFLYSSAVFFAVHLSNKIETACPPTGGVGAFMVQLMVVSFLQQRSREDKIGQRYSNSNLGSLLLDFLELYGLNFNYITTGISVEGGGVYFPKAHDKVFEEFFQMSR